VAPANPAAQGPRLRAVIRRFGPPATQRRFAGRQACFSVWLRPRVAVVTANFGRIPRGSSACAAGVGFVQRFQTLGSSWRTREGVAIGASRARVLSVYPDAAPAAEGDASLLQLKPALHPCVPCTSPEQLQASQRGAAMAFIPRSRVTQLVVQVGAAGD
jgi:transposase